MQHVFIVGSKSLGAYGGYETFVYKLTQYHQNCGNIKYHIACKANGDGYMDESKLKGVKRINDLEFEFHNTHCFKISVPNIGSAVAVYYDIASLNYCCKYIEKNRIKNPIVYILACRIGPFAVHFQKKIHKLGGKIYLNPDGHEWMRKKWNFVIRKYWKISERIMVSHSDLIVCDSKNIQMYIQKTYDKYKPDTAYVAYGAETDKSRLADDDLMFLKWLESKKLNPKNYYLVVGRFVPENNYEIMIKEFMKSHSMHDFALITNVSDKFLKKLKAKTEFHKDSRIKFVGTVYDQELLKKLRENAYGYFHGHEVGGTNPSLLEALSSTNLNLLLDVAFNKECGKDAALYWNKNKGNLALLIDQADRLEIEVINDLGQKAKRRVAQVYSWEFVADEYEKIFMKVGNNK